MTSRMFGTAALIALMAGSAAQASSEATATTELNIRSGPGPWYDVVGVIDADATVAVEGCLEAENWCQVSYNGTDGWAYGDYLSAKVGDQPLALTAPETRQTQTVATVVYDDKAAETTGNTLGGAAFGTIAGALIGGPVGAAAGAALGTAAGVAASPAPEVRTYVTEHPVDPVYLDGEVVVGAGLPAEVELQTVPDSEYGYAYINGVPVIVQPADRTIITIVR